MTLEILLNCIGVLGMLIVVINYFLQQKGILKDGEITYFAVAIISSLMIASSLYTNWNLPSFLLQTTWIILSLIAILRIVRKKR